MFDFLVDFISTKTENKVLSAVVVLKCNTSIEIKYCYFDGEEDWTSRITTTPQILWEFYNESHHFVDGATKEVFIASL